MGSGLALPRWGEDTSELSSSKNFISSAVNNKDGHTADCQTNTPIMTVIKNTLHPPQARRAHNRSFVVSAMHAHCVHTFSYT
jgi:hypothetical protein